MSLRLLGFVAVVVVVAAVVVAHGAPLQPEVGTATNLVQEASSSEGQGAARWLLTDQEVLQAMGGFDRRESGLETMTQGNTIQAFINGDQIFSEVYDLIQSTKGADDFIHASFFVALGDTILAPNASDPEASKHTKLTEALVGAIDRGVDVKVLVSSNLWQALGAISFCRDLNAHCKSDCCAADNRHGSPLSGTNHIKAWTVRSQGELHAFLGSLDISPDRWDSKLHDPNDARHKMQPGGGNRFNLDNILVHESMVLLTGPSAAQVELTFWQRWNDNVRPFMGYSLPKYTKPETAPLDAHGNQTIQLLRTFSCAGGHEGNFKAFAPNGDYTYSAAYFKAIKNAKKYIFMMDQYLMYEDFMKALLDVLPNVDALVLLTNSHAYSMHVQSMSLDFVFNFTFVSDFMQHEQSRALRPLLESPHHNKVHLFRLAETNPATGEPITLYMHDKLLIIDDEFAALGSMSIERVAFTNDAELGVAVHSSDPGGFPATLRKSLWAEFLSLGAGEEAVLDDPIKGVELMDKQADSQLHRLRRYVPEDRSQMFGEDVYNLLNPDGRCL